MKLPRASFREAVGWLAAVTFFFLWLFKGCGDRPCERESTTTIDTLYQDTGRITLDTILQPHTVFVPGARQVDSFFIDADIDTQELMADYFTTRSYILNYDTNEVKLGLRFQVFRNALKDSLSLTVANLRPTQVITNTTTVNNEPKLSLWLGAGVRGNVDATFVGLARAQFRKLAVQYERGLDGSNEIGVSMPVLKFGRK